MRALGSIRLNVLYVQLVDGAIRSPPWSWSWPMQTPVTLAAERGLEGVVMALVEHDGTDINLQDSFGRTPLHWYDHYCCILLCSSMNYVDYVCRRSCVHTVCFLLLRFMMYLSLIDEGASKRWQPGRQPPVTVPP